MHYLLGPLVGQYTKLPYPNLNSEKLSRSIQKAHGALDQAEEMVHQNPDDEV